MLLLFYLPLLGDLPQPPTDLLQIFRARVYEHGGQTHIDIQQEWFLASQAGIEQSTQVLPVSPRVTLSNFHSTIRVGETTNPAGPARIYPTRFSGSKGDQVAYFTALFPGLKPGSRIQFGYTLSFQDILFIRPLSINRTFPVESVEINFDMENADPPAFFSTNPLDPPNQFQLSKRQGKWCLSAKNLPALPAKHSRSELVFQTHGISWSEFRKKAIDLLRTKGIEPSALPSELKKLSSQEEMIELTYRYVQRMRYEDISLGDHDYVPKPPLGTLKDQYGDCKDQSALLIAMLQSQGIAAFPVLVSAGALWEIGQACPALSIFNHVIVGIETRGSTLFLDPTDPYSAPGTLAPSVRGAPALSLFEDGGDIFLLPSTGIPDHRAHAKAQFTDNGTLRWDIQLDLLGTKAGGGLQLWHQSQLTEYDTCTLIAKTLLHPRLAIAPLKEARIIAPNGRKVIINLVVEEPTVKTESGTFLLPSTVLRWPIFHERQSFFAEEEMTYYVDNGALLPTPYTVETDLIKYHFIAKNDSDQVRIKRVLYLNQRCRPEHIQAHRSQIIERNCMFLEIPRSIAKEQ